MTYSYAMSPWIWIVVAFDIVIGLGALTLIGLNVYRVIDKKKHPENYKGK